MYLDHAVPDQLRRFVRRILVLDSKDDIDVTSDVRPTGYIFLGLFFRGRGTVHIDEIENIQFNADEATFAHISGQVLSQEIKLRFQGDVGHVLVEFTALGCYDLLGIEGETTIDNCLPPSSFNPDLDDLFTSRAFTYVGQTADEAKGAILEALITRIGQTSDTPEFLRRGIAEIEKNSGQLNLNDMCERLGISSRHFTRVFKRIVGQSPKRFCQILQLNSALQALMEDDFEYLAEVALEAGFSDQSHFNRVFQQRLLTNPLAFLNGDEQLLKVFLAER